MMEESKSRKTTKAVSSFHMLDAEEYFLRVEGTEERGDCSLVRIGIASVPSNPDK